MEAFPTIEGLREAIAKSGRPVVLVPTMGALHEGHLTLMREARDRAGQSGTVVASIFVNPTQFGPGEDLESYPRPLEEDLAKCDESGVDLVFTPTADEVYFDNRSISVTEESLSGALCGRSRPGHFDGVCLVVLKLFNIVQPDTALFGKKDYQQLAVIKRMVRDLDVPVEVVGVETVRENDGLAMSSRNAYLTDKERAEAPTLRRTLLAIGERAASGNAEAKSLIAYFEEQIAKHAPSGQIDYIEVVDRECLDSIGELVDRPALVACAVHFGKARLIDNLEIGPPDHLD